MVDFRKSDIEDTKEVFQVVMYNSEIHVSSWRTVSFSQSILYGAGCDLAQLKKIIVVDMILKNRGDECVTCRVRLWIKRMKFAESCRPEMGGE